MAALEFGERAPMPIKQLRENFRFHFTVLQFVVALLVARVILAIRIHLRHEHDILPVRGPDRAVRTSRNIRDLMRLTDERARACVKIAHPDLRRISRFRCPNQFLSIRRKTWPFFMVWSRVEAARFAALPRHDP
jgi:hypothetical protein